MGVSVAVPLLPLLCLHFALLTTLVGWYGFRDCSGQQFQQEAFEASLSESMSRSCVYRQLAHTGVSENGDPNIVP